MMSNAFKVYGEKCVKVISVTERNMAYIDDYVNSSPILATALAPHIGYKRAEAVAKQAAKDNATILETCLRDEALVNELGGEERVKEILNPDTMTRWGEKMRDSI